MKGRKLALFMRCNAGSGGQDRAFSKNRKFFYHQPDIRLFGQNRLEIGKNTLAVAAVIIRKFIDRDRGVIPADGRVSGVITDQRKRRLFPRYLFSERQFRQYIRISSGFQQ